MRNGKNLLCTLANEVDRDSLIRAPKLDFNHANETFSGNHPSQASQLLRYRMRLEFAIPNQVAYLFN
jgi:hypothetical protein